MSSTVTSLNTWFCNLCQTSGMGSLSRHLEVVHPRPVDFDYRAAWESCVNDLHRERNYVKRLERETSAMRDFLYEIYHSLPSRRTKLAKRILAAISRPWVSENGD